MLPIQFKTRFSKEELGELTPSEILDVIQNWLEGKGFRYVKRKNDKIIFHKADGWTLFNTRSFLVSGIVKIKNKNGGIVVVNGNWMVLLIVVPFLIIILFAKSRYSTIDEADVDILWTALIVLFGLNLITRIIAHWRFKSTIKEMIKTIPDNIHITSRG